MDIDKERRKNGKNLKFLLNLSSYYYYYCYYYFTIITTITIVINVIIIITIVIIIKLGSNTNSLFSLKNKY